MYTKQELDQHATYAGACVILRTAWISNDWNSVLAWNLAAAAIVSEAAQRAIIGSEIRSANLVSRYNAILTERDELVKKVEWLTHQVNRRP